MTKKNIPSFTPSSRQDWRAWLEENHDKEQAVWLICYKAGSGKPIVAWSEVVDEALCFGWIDSKRKPIDDEKFMQFISKRKPKGTWSKINKEKVRHLTDSGLMTQAGLASIKLAKQNGSWNILDDVEALIVPDDLAKALKAKPSAEKYYQSLSKSVKKILLSWLVLAKREETRKKRIQEVAECASEKMVPKQFR